MGRRRKQRISEEKFDLKNLPGVFGSFSVSLLYAEFNGEHENVGDFGVAAPMIIKNNCFLFANKSQ